MDTSGWACYFVEEDDFQVLTDNIVRRYKKSRTPILTTNYVLTELVALLNRRVRSSRVQQIQQIEMLRTSDWIEIVHVDAALDEAAWQRLKARSDKTWSLMDCTSFVLMQRRGIVEALTTDHHFEQAGLTRLLR